jgi:hypothetical protein
VRFGQAHEVFHRLVALPLRVFFRRQSFLSVLAQQLADALLQFRRGPQGEHFFRRWQFGKFLDTLICRR